MRGWIGVDLDGTLAHYDHWRGIEHIGAPVQPMLDRVKRWLAEGKDVRIFTARVAEQNHSQKMLAIHYVMRWCEQHIGRSLPVTNIKDFAMVELWDDRAVQVEFNTGRRMDGHPEPENKSTL